MVHGLTRAGEEEPEAAEELLVQLVDRGDLEVMEALVDVRREHVGGEFGLYAAGRALARLRSSAASSDDGLLALRAAIAADLAEEEGARRRERRIPRAGTCRRRCWPSSTGGTCDR